MSPRNRRSSPGSAVEAARKQLGFGEARAVAREVALGRETIPFLSRSLSGATTWEVEVTDPVAASRGPQAGTLPPVGRLRILLAPNTMNVMRIESPRPKRTADLPTMPGVVQEQRQLEAQSERIVALPETAPTIVFMKALKSIDVTGPGVVSDAAHLVAYYVIQSTIRYEQRAVWIVHARGISPLPVLGMGREIPAFARNHLRHVVDAGTGEWLFADTVPQPIVR